MAQLLAKRVALGTGAATIGLLLNQPVHLEAEKKSIYDTEEPQPRATSILGEQTTRVAQLTGHLRQQACTLLGTTKEQAQQAVSTWISAERRMERVVQSMVAPNERLLPGLALVGVGVLAGPIFMRRRNVLVRVLSPAVFGVGTMAFVMPGTSMTVLRGVWARYGDPQTIDRVQEWGCSVRRTARDVQGAVVGWVEQLRLSLQEGRSIREAVARPQVKRVVEEAAQAVPENVQIAAAEQAAELPKQTAETPKQAAKEPKQAAETPGLKNDSDLPLGFKSS